MTTVDVDLRLRQRALLFRMRWRGDVVDSTVARLAVERSRLATAPAVYRFLERLRANIPTSVSGLGGVPTPPPTVESDDEVDQACLWAYSRAPDIFFESGYHANVLGRLQDELARQVEALEAPAAYGEELRLVVLQLAIRRLLLFQVLSRAALRAWVHLELDTLLALDGAPWSTAEEGEVLLGASPVWRLVSSFLSSQYGQYWCLGRIRRLNRHLHVHTGRIIPSPDTTPLSWPIRIELCWPELAGGTCLTPPHSRREIGCICLGCLAIDDSTNGSNPAPRHVMDRAALEVIVRTCATHALRYL